MNLFRKNKFVFNNFSIEFDFNSRTKILSQSLYFEKKNDYLQISSKNKIYCFLGVWSYKEIFNKLILQNRQDYQLGYIKLLGQIKIVDLKLTLANNNNYPDNFVCGCELFLENEKKIVLMQIDKDSLIFNKTMKYICMYFENNELMELKEI